MIDGPLLRTVSKLSHKKSNNNMIHTLSSSLMTFFCLLTFVDRVSWLAFQYYFRKSTMITPLHYTKYMLRTQQNTKQTTILIKDKLENIAASINRTEERKILHSNEFACAHRSKPPFHAMKNINPLHTRAMSTITVYALSPTKHLPFIRY